MNNTEKLLRAFIDASGYEVEETHTSLDDFAISDWNNKWRNANAISIPSKPVATIDYKVTKKALPPITYHHCQKCGTHIGKGNPLDSCLCKTSKFLVKVTAT